MQGAENPIFQTGESVKAVGIDAVLAELVRASLEQSSDILALAIGDHQGLPILDATKGKVSVMTFTAMATMSMRSAMTACESVGLQPPDHMMVHSPDGELLLLTPEGTRAIVIGLLRPGANLGLALVVLQALGRRVGQVLR